MSADEGGAEIPQEIITFLTHFSVALHKCRAYPEGHPIRLEAGQTALRLLSAALAGRPALRVTVGRRQLLVDGEATDPSQPVLRELAERLQRRQVGTLTFRAGVEADELVATLDRLTTDPRAKPSPGVALEPESMGPHIELGPMSFGGLRLAQDGGEGARQSPDELWRELARLAEVDGGAVGDAIPVIAETLTREADAPEAAPQAVAALQRFGRAAAEAAGPEGIAARRALANLLKSVPQPVLVRLLDLKLDRPEGASRLLSASEWLAVPALLDLVEAAATSSHQTVSHFFLRLLRKLGARSPGAPDQEVKIERGVREAVQAILRNWTLADPNPPEHTGVLDELSSREEVREDVIELPGAILDAEAGRVIRMALELGAAGELVLAAADRMLEGGQLHELVDLLEGDGDSTAAAAVWGHIVQSDILRRLLLEEPVDHAACAVLLRHAPIESSEGLLDSLVITESEDTRRLIVGRLGELCPAVALPLIGRLDAANWNLRRNILGLMADLPVAPDGFPAKRYIDGQEPLVRREALRLLLRSPVDREEAVLCALADPDDRVVLLALHHGTEHRLPRAALTRLMKLLNSDSRPAELRALGISLLEQFASPAIRHWLIKRVLVRRGIFRRFALAPKSPELRASLAVLARAFPADPHTAEVWRRVEASGDADLVPSGQPNGAA
jgi:hypothetical protein